MHFHSVRIEGYKQQEVTSNRSGLLRATWFLDKADVGPIRGRDDNFDMDIRCVAIIDDLIIVLQEADNCVAHFHHCKIHSDADSRAAIEWNERPRLWCPCRESLGDPVERVVWECF